MINLLKLTARDTLGCNGQLMRREPKGFVSDLRSHSAHLIENTARLHDCHPILGIPLSLAHTRLGRLLGDRLIRKHSRPYLAAALDIPSDGNTRRLYLTAGNRSRFQCLQTKLA